MTAFADRTVVTIAVRGHRVLCEGHQEGKLTSGMVNSGSIPVVREKILESWGQESRELAGRQSRLLGCLEILRLYLLQAFPLFSGFQDMPFPKALGSRPGAASRSLQREPVSLDAWRSGKRLR